MVGKDPVGQRAERQAFDDRRNEYDAALIELLVSNDVLGPIVVGPVGDYEFEFVQLGQMPEIGVSIFFGFAAAGTFQVHDFDDARIHWCDIDRAAGFEQYCFTEVAEARQQRQNIRLEEGFAAGHFDKLGFKTADFGEDVVEGDWLALVEGVSGVAPGAAEVAAGQSHKDAGPPGIRGLPLNAVKDFIDNQRVRHGGTLTNAPLVCKPDPRNG